jgi:sugar phosphate isomerase/epimerase
MEIGLSTATFFGKSLTEDSFDIIKQAGVSVCEVFLTTFSEYEESFGDILAEKKGDLQVHSVHSLTNQFEPQLSNRVERTRRDAFVYFDKVCKTMQKLGAKYYTYHGASIIKKSQLNINYEYESSCLKDIMAKVNEYGGELTFENVHWAKYNKPEFIKKIHQYIPELKTCLDIKQAMQSGIDYKEYIKASPNSIRTVHVCDWNERGLCAPGKGNFDFKELFAILTDVGYTGPVMIELYSGDYKDYREVYDSVDYLKNLL